MKVLNAVRGMYRPKSQQGWVRVASEDCVVDTDMRLLKKVKKLKVSTCGDVKESWFQPLLLDGQQFWASCVTGTLFKSDGSCESPHLRIINL